MNLIKQQREEFEKKFGNKTLYTQFITVKEASFEGVRAVKFQVKEKILAELLHWHFESQGKLLKPILKKVWDMSTALYHSSIEENEISKINYEKLTEINKYMAKLLKDI